jgi:hypothetical protein
MRKFLVRHVEKPAARLDREIGINIRRSKDEIHACRVRNILDDKGEITGLEYDEILEADDIDSAIRASFSELDFLASLISFSSGVAASDLRLCVALSCDEDRAEHECITRDEPRHMQYSSGNAKSDVISAIAEGLEGIGEEEVRDRVIASLQVFRRAQSIKDDPLLRFILLWVSLELISYAMAKKLGKSKKMKGSRQVRALREYLEGQGEGIKDLDDSINIRNKALHSLEDLGSIRNRAREKIDFIVGLYIQSLDFVLGTSVFEKIPKKFIPSIATFFEVHTRIELPEPGPLMTNMSAGIPHVHIKHRPDVLVSCDDGQTTIRATADFTPMNFPKNAKLTHKTVIRCMGTQVKESKIL